MREFYVYEHWRTDIGLPFYVGKGKGNRASRWWHRQKHHKNLVAKLRRGGFDVEVRLIFTGLDEEMAFALERCTIAYWRQRGIQLLNLTDGGEGPAGHRWSVERRERHRHIMKELRNRPEVKAKIKATSDAQDVGRRRALKLREIYKDPGMRRRIGDAVRAARASPEVRAEMAEATRRAHAQPEVKARHRAAVKAWWDRRKSNQKEHIGGTS